MSTAKGKARTVVIGPSWLGDCVMALPALQRYAEAREGVVDVVAKPAVTRIWEMSDAVGKVIELKSGNGGMREVIAQIRAGEYEKAIVLPNSWRTGLLPLLGGVRVRRGAPGHARGWMLTELVLKHSPGHQSLEMASLFGVDPVELPAPALACGEDEGKRVLARLKIDATGPVIAVIPGAARGPAKRWPSDRFESIVRGARTELGATVVLCGTSAERALCSKLAFSPDVVNAAGKTSLRELACLLSRCTAVVCNDSGGMHLAAAMGAPVVAIFGLTDPSRTGPLGAGHRLVVAKGVTHDRRIGRDDEVARAALASISESQVLVELLSVSRERLA